MNRHAGIFRYIYPSFRALVGVKDVKVNIRKGPPTPAAMQRPFPMSILPQSCKQKAGNAVQCTRQGKNLTPECKNSFAGFLSDSGL